MSIDLKKLQHYQLETMKEVDRICKKNNITYFLIGGTLLGAVRHKGFIPWDMDLDIAMFREDYDKFIKYSKQDLSNKYFLQNYKTDVDYFPSLTRICINDTYTVIKRSKHLKHHKGIYIDIFPIDNVSDNIEERSIQKRKLRTIDKIKTLKAGYIYDNGTLYWKKTLKIIIKFLLGSIPLIKLQSYREKVMTKYRNQNTKYVCSTASHYSYDKQVMEREIYGNPSLIEFEGELFYAPQKVNDYLNKLYGDYMKLPPLEDRVTVDDVYEDIRFYSKEVK